MFHIEHVYRNCGRCLLSAETETDGYIFEVDIIKCVFLNPAEV